ncbi:MAG: YggT family protein [Gemmatimonadetes bacterium]|nr:YggT family protein [Gemmatimonadota bacterium]
MFAFDTPFLEALRYAVFLVFVGSAGVAVASWAVRTRRIDPFSATARAVRRLTDPIVEPVERWLVKSGGNPQNAGWWIFGVALVGGIVIISLATWITGQLALASAVGTSGRGALKLVIYYAGQVVLMAIVIRVIGSWIGIGRYNRWMRPVYLLTDWVIEPMRKIVPPLGMFDITPLVAWFLLQIVLSWLMRTI